MFSNFGCRKEQSKETHVEIEAVEEADGEENLLSSYQRLWGCFHSCSRGSPMCTTSVSRRSVDLAQQPHIFRNVDFDSQTVRK